MFHCNAKAETSAEQPRLVNFAQIVQRSKISISSRQRHIGLHGHPIITRKALYYLNSTRLWTGMLLFGLFLATWPVNSELALTYRWGTSQYIGSIYRGAQDVQTFWVSIGSWLILGALALGNLEKLRQLLSSKVLQWLGQISFALYLYHGPLICSFGAALVVRLTEAGLPYNFAACIMLLPLAALAIAISHVATMTIDKYAVHLAFQLERQMFKDKDDERATLATAPNITFT